jgi:hypothetical protein
VKYTRSSILKYEHESVIDPPIFCFTVTAFLLWILLPNFENSERNLWFVAKRLFVIAAFTVQCILR